MEEWLLGGEYGTLERIRIMWMLWKLCMLRVASGFPENQCDYIEAQRPMLYWSRVDSGGDMSREVEASSAVLLDES